MLSPNLYASFLLAILVIAPLHGQTNTIDPSVDPLIIDGNLDDAFWQSTAPQALTPDNPGGKVLARAESVDAAAWLIESLRQ